MLLDRAEELANDEAAADSFVEDDDEGMLGIIDSIKSRLGIRPRHEHLRHALSSLLSTDKSFDPTVEDDCYKDLNQAVGDKVDFLIAGHTHLEKSITRSGGGAYFNSGTWIRLINLTADILDSEEKFKEVFECFDSPEMKMLDDCDGLILRKPTVVSIVEEGTSVYGELRHVILNKKNNKVKLVPVPHSRQERTS